MSVLRLIFGFETLMLLLSLCQVHSNSLVCFSSPVPSNSRPGPRVRVQIVDVDGCQVAFDQSLLSEMR